MITLIRVLVISCFFSFFSCNKEIEIPLSEGDLIFGFFSGECIGPNCVVYYKLNKKELWKDALRRYDAKAFLFNKKMSKEKFELVSDLLTKVPDYLLTQPDTTFGCPDCADGGGLFAAYQLGRKKMWWRLDQNTNLYEDENTRNFINELHEKIFLLIE